MYGEKGGLEGWDAVLFGCVVVRVLECDWMERSLFWWRMGEGLAI